MKTKRKKKNRIHRIHLSKRTISCDENCPNHGDGLNDTQRAAQRRFADNDSLGGETGRYLNSIRGTCDDPGE